MADQQEQSHEGARAAWMGVLAAFKEAIDETIDDLRERDVTPERAKETVRGSMRRAQQAMEGVRGRRDFVPRREFDLLRQEVADLRQRVTDLEAGAGEPGPPEAS